MEDEKNLFASRDNPVCSAIEYNGESTRIEVKHGD